MSTEKFKKYKAEWYLKNRDRVREVTKKYHYKRKFNLTLEEYSAILLEQDSVCAICKSKETAKDARTGLVKNLAIDHCHTTGKVRGLLCTKCNIGLGAFNDNNSLLMAASEYLKEHNVFSSEN